MTKTSFTLIHQPMTETFAEQRKEFVSARRQAFMASAAKTLSERGIYQAKMNDIAAEAGVAKVVLYRYFGSKEKLVHAILEDIVEQILEADAADHSWWTDRVRSTLEIARQNKFALILLIRIAAHDPNFSEHFKRLQNVIGKRVDERVGSVLADKKPITGETSFLSEAITTFFFTAYLRWLENDTDDEDEAFFRWVTNAVRAMSYYWHNEDPARLT